MYKKHNTYYIILHICVFSFFLLASCNSSTKWNDIDFYQVDKLEQLTEKPLAEEDDEFASMRDTADRTMDVRVDMQFMKSDVDENENVCRLINDQLIEIVLNQSSEMTVDEAVERYIEVKKQEFHADEITPEMYVHLTGRAEYGARDIINYRLMEEFYTGGAHPCVTTTLLCFNALTGEFISIDNLFNYQHQQTLKDMLLNKLMKDKNAQNLEELRKMGYLEMMEMFISPNFALREDSIEFYYNEYDIAPYASGPTKICLSYDDIKAYISDIFE